MILSFCKSCVSLAHSAFKANFVNTEKPLSTFFLFLSLGLDSRTNQNWIHRLVPQSWYFLFVICIWVLFTIFSFFFLFFFSPIDFVVFTLSNWTQRLPIITVQVASLDIEKEREAVQMQLLMLKLKGSSNNQAS